MQSSSLSTYIGYITGPRAEQPIGVRVVEPPIGTRQHQRGSLYAVVEVTGDHPDRGAIVDRLLSEVHRVYYSAKGSQSQVMVEAVQQTQQLLRDMNAHTPHYPLQAGISCAALLGGKLLVGTSGAAFALICVGGKVHMFPSEPSAPSLGAYGNIPVEVHRQDVQAEDTLFLGGGSWLRRVQTRTLASIVAFTTADNCTDAADELYEQAGQMQVPGLLIVLGAGGNGEPPRPSGYSGYSGGGGGYPGSPSGGSSGGTGNVPPRGPAPRRPRFSGLPTAVNTTPPARLPSDPGANVPPPSSPLYPSSSSPPTAFSSGATQTSLPPSEVLSPREVRQLEPLPPSAPQATVDEPVVETPLRQSRSLESATSDIEAYDNPIDGASSNESLETETVSAESFSPYPVSPLEDSSFGGDLPVEPGDEYDPLFPATSGQETLQRPVHQPSWLEQWQGQASQRMAKARLFLAGMLPGRQEGESSAEWDELSDDQESSQKPNRTRYNEVEAAQAQASPTPSSLTPSSASVSTASKRVTTASQVESTVSDQQIEKSGVAPVLDMSPFAPPAPASGARARLVLLIALVIVLLVPVVVAAVNIGQGNSRRAEAEQLTARAEIVLLGAQSALDQGDKVTARERLTEAQDYLAQAIEIDGTNDHRSQLIATIESELQEVLQVIPLYGLTEPLITFPADARPQRILVMNDDIFVIDGGRQALLQYRFDPASGLVTDQLGQVILSQGDQIGNVTVGTLADIAWLPLIPGFEDRPSLLITDRNNNVFRYDQRVEGATVMNFGDRASWGSIGQIQTFNGRIYLADEGNNDLLRYNPGQYQQPGDKWFAPETQPPLAGLISMEIDGDIWMLFSNKMILRYRERESVPFSAENTIGLAEEPTDMYVTRQESAYIYLVDAGQDRILVYDKSGAYVGQLRAPENDLLRGLTGIYIDEVGGVMYILTQTGLFTHPVLP